VHDASAFLFEQVEDQVGDRDARPAVEHALTQEREASGSTPHAAAGGPPTQAVARYREQGVAIERVLSDNAKAYHSFAWRDACAELGIARRYTRPYSPWTNGKAEAVIKTLLREWAYRFAYPTSEHRARALPGFARWYNRRRPHGSLGGRPPISRVSHVCGQYP
jgi:transposase InsO family protein